MITSYNMTDQTLEHSPVSDVSGIQSEIYEKIYSGAVYQEFVRENGNVAAGEHLIHRGLNTSND